MVKKYKEYNVGQCWSCTNCVGHHIIYKNISGGLSHEPTAIGLPECKVQDMYMTYVCRETCPCFKPRTTEYMIPGEN